MPPTLADYFTLLVRRPEDGVLLRVGSVRSRSLNSKLGTLKAANPDGYDSTYSVPGQGSWDVQAGRLHAYVGERVQPSEGYRILRDAHDGQYAYVVLSYPNGATKEGQCLVPELPTSGGTGQSLTGEIKLKGVGDLERNEGLRFWGDGGSYDGTGTWTDKSSYGHDATQDTSGEQPGKDTSGDFPVLTFDGSDDSLRLPDPVFRSGDYGFTFAGVVRLDVDKNHTVLGGAAEGTETGPSEIDLDTQDSVNRLSLRIGEAPVIKSPEGSVELGAFTSFLVSYEPGRGRVLIVGGQQVNDDVDTVLREDGIYYAGKEGTSGNYLQGAIADLRIFGGALAPSLRRQVLADLSAKYLNP
jgi:hypothetical protein